MIEGRKQIPFIDGLLGLAKGLDGNFWNFCNKTGDFKGMNISFNNFSLYSNFPSGEFRTTFSLYDDGGNIMNLTYYATIRK